MECTACLPPNYSVGKRNNKMSARLRFYSSKNLHQVPRNFVYNPLTYCPIIHATDIEVTVNFKNNSDTIRTSNLYQ